MSKVKTPIFGGSSIPSFKKIRFKIVYLVCEIMNYMFSLFESSVLLVNLLTFLIEIKIQEENYFEELSTGTYHWQVNNFGKHFFVAAYILIFQQIS